MLIGAIVATVIWLLLPAGGFQQIGQPPQISSGTSPQPPGVSVAPGTVVQPTQAYNHRAAAQAKTRLDDVEREYKRLSTMRQEGRRCEALVAFAEATLDPSDKNFATAGAVQQALSEISRCRSTLGRSDARFEDLVGAAELAASDQAAGRARLLLLAPAISDFDRTRTRISAESRAALQQLDDAVRAAGISTQRVTAFLDAARGVDADAAGRDRLQAVATTFAALDDDDLRKLNAMDAAAMRLGNDVTRHVKESEQRWKEVETAARAAASGSRPAQRDMVMGIAALTPFDRRIASPEQQALLDEWAPRARSYALDLLVVAADAYRDDKSPSNYERLAELRELLGPKPATTSPEQAEAVELSVEASAEIDRSNRRLAEVVELAEGWNEARTESVARRIQDAYDDITELDRGRADSTQANALATIDVAIVIITGGPLTEATKSQVPIFVERDGTDAWYLDFSNLMRRGGYQVVDDPHRAALEVELKTPADPALTQNQVGALNVYGAVATVSMASRWTFDGQEYFSATVDARASSSIAARALNDSYANAAKRLYTCFNSHVKGAETGCN